MTDIRTVQQLNRELAKRINEETLQNPESSYAHKYVGIANGQVVVVADDLEELVSGLQQAEPDPARTFGIEASRDYTAVEYIWRMQVHRSTLLRP